MIVVDDGSTDKTTAVGVLFPLTLFYPFNLLYFSGYPSVLFPFAVFAAILASNLYGQCSSGTEVEAATAETENMENAKKPWFHRGWVEVDQQVEVAGFFFFFHVGERFMPHPQDFRSGKGLHWFPAKLQPRCLSVSIRLNMRDEFILCHRTKSSMTRPVSDYDTDLMEVISLWYCAPRGSAFFYAFSQEGRILLLIHKQSLSMFGKIWCHVLHSHK